MKLRQILLDLSLSIQGFGTVNPDKNPSNKLSEILTNIAGQEDIDPADQTQINGLVNSLQNVRSDSLEVWSKDFIDWKTKDGNKLSHYRYTKASRGRSVGLASPRPEMPAGMGMVFAKSGVLRRHLCALA